jgi:hypothetical protein
MAKSATAVWAIRGILGLTAVVGAVVCGLVIWSRWAPTHLGRTRTSMDRAAACATLIDLAEEIANFRAREGRLPGDLHEAATTVPQDPWGGTIQYQANADGTYRLRSNGPDRLPNTPDDMIVPKFDAAHPRLPPECAP